MWWLLSCVMAAPEADLIESLPGWKDELPCKMYSGFVHVPTVPGKDLDMQVHYWYMESEGDATTDPTIVWTNGGPGASSMFGILVELGPLLVNLDSLSTQDYQDTGVPTLFANDYAWTKVGSILMFDWPPPVGFSYCGDPANATECGDWDDDTMAELEFAALKGWYDLFPERLPNDLYITGESYAGIYVPRLVDKLVDDGSFPLVGFAVGDGCAGTEILCGGNDAKWWDVLFLYGHGQVSNLLFDSIMDTCGIDYLKYGGVAPEGCSTLLSAMQTQVGGYYEYNLYDDCIYHDDLRRRKLGALNDYVCGGGDASTVYLNQSVVRTALHVPLDSDFFNADGENLRVELILRR